MKPDDVLIGLEGTATEGVYRPCSVTLSRRDLTGRRNVERELIDWPGAIGWIARESGVFAPGIADDDPTKGAVLEAELTLGMKSLQIRRTPGFWMLTEIFESDGETNLADDLRLVTVDHGVALYRRYWSLPDDGADGAVEAVACRLIGFEGVR